MPCGLDKHLLIKMIDGILVPYGSVNLTSDVPSLQQVPVAVIV